MMAFILRAEIFQMVKVLALFMFAATTVRAETLVVESHRSMFVEFKLSPYTPLVDRSFASSPGPYESIFGNTPTLLWELEVEYQLFQRMGSLAVGVSGGYAEKSGKALKEATLQAADQSTSLKLVPIKALVIYRFDWLFLKHSIPLVPYLKGGFVMMPWWVLKGDEIERVADSARGAGISYGLVGVVGLALTLDILDRRMARDLDNSIGINHSYLFAEFSIQEMGMFVPHSIDLSSRHWMFGFGFEL